MANDDSAQAAENPSAGENTSPSDGLSLSSASVGLANTVLQGTSKTILDNDDSATLLPTVRQSVPVINTSRPEDTDYQRFFKSIEARIDPEDPPNLLLTEPDLVRVGTIQIGSYTCPLLDQIALIKKLGEGGNGSVFLGYQHHFGEVALKTLKIKVLQSDPGMVGRFFLEARLSKKFASPHIVKTFDARREGDLNFLVMEYISGSDAAGYLKKLKKSVREEGIIVGIPEREALQVCAAACAGLKALHDVGVMHRDIKPQNIMIPFGKNNELRFEASKLMDLGLAKTTDVDAPSMLRKLDDPTIQGTLLGTPGYMAPEQVIDCTTVTPAADIFSLGATLYCLMCGSPPFRDVQGPLATASATIHGNHIPILERCAKNKIALSRGTATIIEQCLRKNIGERYTSAGELLADLERVLAGKEPLAKRPPRKAISPWYWAGGGAAIIATGVAALLIFKPFSAKFETHQKFLQQAIESLEADEFDAATMQVNLAIVARINSPLSTDSELINHETLVNTKIQAAKEKFETFCKTQLAEFRKSVKAEDFPAANSKLDALKRYEKHLPEKILTLQGELDAAKKAYEVRKAIEERERKERFDNAIKGANAALGRNDFADATRNYKAAAAIDSSDATVLQLAKDIPRRDHTTQIETILQARGDLTVAKKHLDEIKKIDASHAIIPDLTGRIDREESRRAVVLSLDAKLALLQAGKGDLGDVNALIAQLSPDDADRKSREPQTLKTRADFDKLLTSAKGRLDASKDIDVAETELKSAQKIWPSNSDLKGLLSSLDKANATFDKLIADINAEVIPQLADAQSKLDRARSMKPSDQQVAEYAKLIENEKTLQSRIDSLNTLVSKVDSAENFDAVGIELNAIAAIRKDPRVDAARTLFDTKLVAYKEKLRTIALGKMQAELTALGKYGDGSAYAALEKRIDDLAADAPQDKRILTLGSAFAEKKRAAEEVSVFGRARKLKKLATEFGVGAVTLKQLEDELVSAETEFPKAFTEARKIVEDGKVELFTTVSHAIGLATNRQNLDHAESILKEAVAAYPALSNIAEARKAIDDANAEFTRDLATVRAKLESGASIEGVDLVLNKDLIMRTTDASLLALMKDLERLKFEFKGALSKAEAAGKSGNIEAAEKDLDRVAKLFPNDPGIPVANGQLITARASLQKDLAQAEKFLATSSEKGNYAKAAEILAAAQLRVPSDPTLAKLEVARKKVAEDTEALVPAMDKLLATNFTTETLAQAQQLLERLDAVGPHPALRAGFKKRKDEFDTARELAARDAAATRARLEAQAAAKPKGNTSTEDPSNFGN